MFSGADSSEMCEGFDDADRSVNAAIEKDFVVKINDSCDTAFIERGAENRTNHRIETSRFENNGCSQPIFVFFEIVSSCLCSCLERSWSALDHDSGGFSLGMGVDGMYLADDFGQKRALSEKAWGWEGVG